MQPSCAPGRRGVCQRACYLSWRAKPGALAGVLSFSSLVRLCVKSTKGKGTELFAFVSYESRKASINQNALQYKSFFREYWSNF